MFRLTIFLILFVITKTFSTNTVAPKIVPRHDPLKIERQIARRTCRRIYRSPVNTVCGVHLPFLWRNGSLLADVTSPIYRVALLANNNLIFFLLADKELKLLVIHDSIKQRKICMRKHISNAVKYFWHVITLTWLIIKTVKYLWYEIILVWLINKARNKFIMQNHEQQLGAWVWFLPRQWARGL